MSSPPPAAAGPPPSAGIPSKPASASASASASAAAAPSTSTGVITYIKLILTDPRTYIIASILAFIISIGYVFVNSGVNLNAMDTNNLSLWWVGTITSSILFLLLFYVVFQKSEHFNKGLLFLLLMSFFFIHISLLLTQVNLVI